MASRLSLHEELTALLGSSNVYFQPPESIKLSYPCIIYGRSNAEIEFANDMPYNYTKAYDITIIDKNPDSSIVDSMYLAFPMIRYARHYNSDGLNHDVFTVYY